MCLLEFQRVEVVGDRIVGRVLKICGHGVRIQRLGQLNVATITSNKLDPTGKIVQRNLFCSHDCGWVDRIASIARLALV